MYQQQDFEASFELTKIRALAGTCVLCVFVYMCVCLIVCIYYARVCACVCLFYKYVCHSLCAQLRTMHTALQTQVFVSARDYLGPNKITR